MRPYDGAKYWDEVGRVIESGGADRRWDVAGQDSPFFRYKRDRLVALLRGLRWSGRTVLEVGPGPGGNLRLLRALGAEAVVGVDISFKMAQVAVTSTRGIAPPVQILVGDGAHLPVKSKSIDVGLTVTVLQHLDANSAPQVVTEMGRVCRDEIILCEDVAITATAMRMRTTHIMRRKEDYVEMARDAGFRLVGAIPLNVFVSESVSTMVRAVADGLSQSDDDNPSLGRKRAEQVLMPLTSLFDPHVPQLGGLVCMHFLRDS